MYLTRDSDRAQDLVQGAFERLLSTTPQLPPEKVLPWLIVVMRHLFVDSTRAPEARWTSLPEVDYPDLANESAEKEERASAKVRLEDAEVALRSLPESSRHPYQMHVQAHLTYREIAQLLHIETATVGTRIHRARRQLREILLPLASAARIGRPRHSTRCPLRAAAPAKKQER
jgi:RNA polymerase sigma-70 factor (ECF subfamily)